VNVPDFAGKNVLITGGSSGIGKRLAITLLERGADVTIVADRADKLERARIELEALSPSVHALTCDIADLDQVRRTATSYLALRGVPDVLVNNAGYAVYRPLVEMASEEIDRLLRVNLTGACLMTRELLPAMIQKGSGHIVLISSIAGFIPMTPCGPYSVAKHGMVAFGEILQSEVHRFGLRVHVVCPGRVETDFFSHETFRRRAPRRETEWTVPIEDVCGAVIDSIRSNRLVTYVPRTFRPLVWLTQAVPFVFKPMLRKLMRARIESVYASR